jgi:hypothetical protein
MRRRLVKLKAAALFALIALAGSVPAEAQVRFSPYDNLPPHEVAAIVRSLQLRPIARPVRWGSTYVVRAMNRDGDLVRVVIDAEEGDVLAIRHVYGWQVAGRYSRFGPLAPELEEVRPPIPPRAVPRTTRSRGEERSAALTPPATPLPRPRPGETAEPPGRETVTPPGRPAARSVGRETPVETTGSIAPAPAEAKPRETQAPGKFPPVAPLE